MTNGLIAESRFGAWLESSEELVADFVEWLFARVELVVSVEVCVTVGCKNSWSVVVTKLVNRSDVSEHFSIAHVDYIKLILGICMSKIPILRKKLKVVLLMSPVNEANNLKLTIFVSIQLLKPLRWLDKFHMRSHKIIEKKLSQVALYLSRIILKSYIFIANTLNLFTFFIYIPKIIGYLIFSFYLYRFFINNSL